VQLAARKAGKTDGAAGAGAMGEPVVNELAAMLAKRRLKDSE
jgi:hypothetical protein